MKTKVDWGIALDRLPVMEWDDFQAQTRAGHPLILVAGVVHDVGSFIGRHPGGKAMISSGIGKDATAMFNGGVYNRTYLSLCSVRSETDVLL